MKEEVEEEEYDDDKDDDSCKDEDPSCEEWANAGECKRNPAFMNTSCRYSCMLCDEDNEELASKERVEWLKHHGVCIDTLYAGKSTNGGRGAFAKTAIQKGDLITPAPLLVLKREDLRIYEANETQAAFRNVLNFDKVIGEEVLLNYCHGHSQSQVLLLPNVPIVNYINHAFDKEPNAEIQWPPGYSNDWLKSILWTFWK